MSEPEITEAERETLHRIVNGDTHSQPDPAHLERLSTLGLIEESAGGWRATEAGRVAGIPRPEHL